MGAVRKLAVVEEDGQVTVRGLPYKKGDRLKIVFSKDKPRRQGMTARELLDSPLIGLWADRKDITDSSKFARQLREKAQNRRNGK